MADGTEGAPGKLTFKVLKDDVLDFQRAALSG